VTSLLALAPQTARFSSLEQWLSWQKTLHPRKVDLGLDRVSAVLERLLPKPPRYRVITVGGTNGKGSTVAFLEAILRAGGYRIGTYTSPFLLRYNEQIRINGSEVEDAVLCEAFAQVDHAREDISLSCFEFGTLAALKIFYDTDIEIALLEVGLGGRLDAVNALDADVAVVTTIAIDHVDWLGPDRTSIGYEKAGIYRSGRPAICADPEPPQSLLEHARGIGADLLLYGKDYGYRREGESWSWWSGSTRLDFLPLPSLVGEHQLANAAAALMALHALTPALSLHPDTIRLGLLQARIAGRFQVFSVGAGEWILDIAHNLQGAQTLARCLHARPADGRTLAIFGILGDKDALGVIRALDDEVNHWYIVSLPGSRGVNAEHLAIQLRQAGIDDQAIHLCGAVETACQAAQKEAVAGDRIIVCGSSYTVSAVLQTGMLGGEVWKNL
jgi:dihydrofolate synthase/folylpolyglutamate synthase